eukprot:gene7877-16120_t
MAAPKSTIAGGSFEDLVIKTNNFVDKRFHTYSEIENALRKTLIQMYLNFEYLGASDEQYRWVYTIKKSTLGSALKGNDYLHQSVMTGSIVQYLNDPDDAGFKSYRETISASTSTTSGSENIFLIREQFLKHDTSILKMTSSVRSSVSYGKTISEL